jgi:tRNA-guanine family transglycosylase
MLRTYALTQANPKSSRKEHQSLTKASQTTRARAATLHLPHGPVPLPIFMPVATQASLKGLTPKQLEETGCRLCLNNTYHLYADLEAGREYGYTSLDAMD